MNLQKEFEFIRDKGGFVNNDILFTYRKINTFK